MLQAARFDWYQATFEAGHHDDVATSLALALGAEVGPATARYGYAAARSVQVEDRVLATVFGGSPRDGEVHVQAQSDACDLVVPVVRSLWPEHRVSRMDSAIDFSGTFAEVDVQVLAFAVERGIKFRLVTDSDGGATRYLGSPSSEVMTRVYDKSAEMHAKHPDQADEIPEGVIRAEVVVRPGKRAAKDSAALSTPEDAWGFSEWSAYLAADLLMLMPLRESTHFRRSSDWARLVYYLGKQYGPAVQARAADRGSEATLREIARALGLES